MGETVHIHFALVHHEVVEGEIMVMSHPGEVVFRGTGDTCVFQRKSAILETTMCVRPHCVNAEIELEAIGRIEEAFAWHVPGIDF